ncbi:cysteine desulfurase [Paenibacillus psychroresistens]|uniref:cysteine desulfurase n=1 Tax=Paenibacillus psychroresistens TaxID=1778678 RepID=A0A6B8RIB0_9BACL|nr:cysteine desulfurase family protein [Paenibacillus psychroresistens]QGQ95474.1 cysteine desulfurase [Paenibacillus psychroresistens]
MKAIYLDHAASTPLHPIVIEQMLPFWTEVFGNPSSIHAWGRASRSALNDAREVLAGALNCVSKEIIWTSGGTESDNLAIFGTVLAIASTASYKNHIITSQIEHHAVLHSCEQLERLGFNVTYLPVDSQGLVCTKDLAAAIRPETALISIIYGNNEVGTIQPIAELGKIAHDHGILFHVDAVQCLGTEAIDLSILPIDLMSLSAHKIQGPKGIGALFCSSKIKLNPLQFGGSQERKRRAGTENVAGAVGFAAAVKLIITNKANKIQHLEALRKTMLESLRLHLGDEGFVVNGHSEMYLPHILNISFPGVETETMLMSLDLAGIAAASGSACTSGSLEVSHVLKAMHLPDGITSSAIRFSFGSTNTEAEIEQCTQVIATIVQRIRNK